MAATDVPVQVPERIRVQAEAQNPQRSFPASGYSSAPLEGWLQRRDSLWHYMRDGVSLCGSERQGAHHLRPHLKGGAKPCRVCAGVLAGTVKPAAPDGGKLAVLDQLVAGPPVKPVFHIQRRQANGKNWQGTSGTAYLSLEEAQARLAEIRGDYYPVTRLRVARGRGSDIEAATDEVSGSRVPERKGKKMQPPTPEAPPAPTESEPPTKDSAYRVQVLQPDSAAWMTIRFGLTYADAVGLRGRKIAEHNRTFKFRVVDDDGRLQGRELPGRHGEIPSPTNSLAARIASLIDDEASSRMTDVLTELAAVKAERDTLKAKLTAIQTALGGTI